MSQIQVHPQHTQRPVKMNRTNRRKHQQSILDFAEIFEAFKKHIEGLSASNPDEEHYSDEEINKLKGIIFGMYQNRWKEYCRKWNSKKGNPEIKPELFTIEANKYLNELHTMPSSAPAE